MAFEDDSDDDLSQTDPNDNANDVSNAGNSFNRNKNAVNATRVGTASWRRVRPSTYDMQYHQVRYFLHRITYL